MKQQILFLNGPPGSGKDTAATWIYEEHEHARIAKFATLLRQIAWTMFDIPPHMQRMLEQPEHKNRPRPEFMGMSWRELLIWISEDVIKPKLGEAFPGVRVAKQLAGPSACTITAISDSGFAYEAEPVIQQFGIENCHLFRLHRDGCTFNGDSRGYWSKAGLDTRDIHNRYDLKLFRIQVLVRVDVILGIKRDPQYYTM